MPSRYPVEVRKQVVELARSGTRVAQLADVGAGEKFSTGEEGSVSHRRRQVRPLFKRTRTHQRTVYQPGEICQWDLWETSRPVPVGHGQARRAWVVVCCLGYSRAGAGALILSKEAVDVGPLPVVVLTGC